MNRPHRLIPAEFALKGALTRLALFFYGAREQKFTGEEVSCILLSSWNGYQSSRRPPSPDSHLGAVEATQ